MASIAMTLVPRSGFSAEVYVSFKGPSPFTDNDNTKVANAITEYLGFYQRYFTYKTINFSAPDRPAIRMEMNADWSLHVQFCSPITCVDVGGGCSKVDVAQTPDPQEWPRAVRKALATRCLDQNTPVVNKLRDNVPLGLHTHPPQLPLGELYMRITRDGSPPSIPDWLYVSHLLISGKTNNVISVPDCIQADTYVRVQPKSYCGIRPCLSGAALTSISEPKDAMRVLDETSAFYLQEEDGQILQLNSCGKGNVGIATK